MHPLSRYYYIYKPYQVLSQFTSPEGKATLKDVAKVEQDVYPVVRLDYDSEGLLILTNDKKLNHLLLNPDKNHKRIPTHQIQKKRARHPDTAHPDGRKKQTSAQNDCCRGAAYAQAHQVQHRKINNKKLSSRASKRNQ